MQLRNLFTAFLAVTLALRLAPAARAQDQTNLAPTLIRDAEIESTIRTWWTPILLAAHLDPAATHIYIVEDPELNAFVAGGQNLFLNTGMLLRAETPNQLIGVMAHETGHIAGGHLARTDRAMRNASIEGMIAIAAAAAAALATRSPDALAAGMLGSSTVAESSFMSFSVGQEASADHAALTFLDRTHQSARGLYQFFQILEHDEMLDGLKEDPFLRSHPLTQDRMQYIEQHIKESPWSDAKDPPEWVEMDAIMRAKLDAFLNGPAQALQDYPPSNTSVPARYARAIAYYRVPELTKALDLINGLIKDEPANPYFEELKGQMLFENGHVADAVAPYQRAVALKPDNALLKVEAAQVELETNDPALLHEATTLLNDATLYENDNPDLWRYLAIAQGRAGNMGMMSLSLAEESMANGDWSAARAQAARAIKLLPPGAQRQRAQDIADDARRSRNSDD